MPGRIPSIIFGLFGFIFFVVMLKMGWSLLSGGLTLAIMILPTIIRTSEEAIRAVPHSFREVSFSLGATRWETVMKVVLPNALPGIVTGLMLGIGRCISETAAVIFTAGSSLRLPQSGFDSVRTMAVHFYILAREGLSNENAYGTAAVLIIAVLLTNLTAYWLMRGSSRGGRSERREDHRAQTECVLRPGPIVALGDAGRTAQQHPRHHWSVGVGKTTFLRTLSPAE